MVVVCKTNPLMREREKDILIHVVMIQLNNTEIRQFYTLPNYFVIKMLRFIKLIIYMFINVTYVILFK